ncbi:hypothetical protein DN508_38860, partial [Burkholderia multivorans]
AWAFARKADEIGVDIIQNCEVTDIHRDGDQVTGVETTLGRIATEKVAVAVAGHTSVAADMAGIRRPTQSPPAPRTRLRALRTRPPDRRHVQPRPRLRLPGAQGRTRHGRRRRLVQRLRAARGLPHHRGAARRRGRALPDLRPRPRPADLGRHRRRHPRRLPDRVEDGSPGT